MPGVLKYWDGSAWVEIDVPGPVGPTGPTGSTGNTGPTGPTGTSDYNAGRNVIINGGFDVWQRGTSFSNPASQTYTADRCLMVNDGTGATRTISRQTFTPGAAPSSEYEAQYFFRYAQSVAGTGGTVNDIYIPVEDVRTLAGRTVTFSVWAKSAGTTQFSASVAQIFGSGGSATTFTNISSFTTSTSWQRFSATVSIPSLSGKTVGTGSYIILYLGLPKNSTFTLDFWGVQLEAGSIATRFEEKTYAETLRQCQRYYYRLNADAHYTAFFFGRGESTTYANGLITFPVELRVAPSSVLYGGTFELITPTPTGVNVTALSLNTQIVSRNAVQLSASATVTAGTSYYLRSSNNLNSFIAFSAEL